MAKTSIRDLVHISVQGVVQGVGFRPFVYQLASRYNLKGWVCNTSEDVKIEVEGETGAIEQFLLALKEQAPPRASIENIQITRHPPANYEKFEIRHSIAEEGKYQLISPDIATCRDRFSIHLFRRSIFRCQSKKICRGSLDRLRFTCSNEFGDPKI